MKLFSLVLFVTLSLSALAQVTPVQFGTGSSQPRDAQTVINGIGGQMTIPSSGSAASPTTDTSGNYTSATGNGVQAASSESSTGSQDEEAQCVLVDINNQAAKGMAARLEEAIEAQLGSTELNEIIWEIGNNTDSCVADLKTVWDKVAGGFKVGSGGINLDLGKILQEFDPTTLLEKAKDEALEQSCKIARDKVNEQFSRLSTLANRRIDFGRFGSISTAGMIKYNGEGYFKVNVNTPSTSNIINAIESMWR